MIKSQRNVLPIILFFGMTMLSAQPMRNRVSKYCLIHRRPGAQLLPLRPRRRQCEVL